ncbi:hypothetical protein DSM25559_0344 [Agrobacterium rosae]|uniref:Uncharacterized protein n=1 Tax=Agrobacterium rosae TaxID=1972867 RepID=A0A1R3T8A6_9HYPH|nr:hypothetical protein DSM25559_0344 [Agrobacterium rosae]
MILRRGKKRLGFKPEKAISSVMSSSQAGSRKKFRLFADP